MIYPVDPIILVPLVTETVGAGCKEPMNNCQKDSPLHIELILPATKKPLDDLPDPQLFPEPLEDQGGTDLLGDGMDLTLPGQNQPIRLPGLKPGVCSGLTLSTKLRASSERRFLPRFKNLGLAPSNVSN